MIRRIPTDSRVLLVAIAWLRSSGQQRAAPRLVEVGARRVLEVHNALEVGIENDKNQISRLNARATP